VEYRKKNLLVSTQLFKMTILNPVTVNVRLSVFLMFFIQTFPFTITIKLFFSILIMIILYLVFTLPNYWIRFKT